MALARIAAWAAQARRRGRRHLQENSTTTCALKNRPEDQEHEYDAADHIERQIKNTLTGRHQISSIVSSNGKPE